MIYVELAVVGASPHPVVQFATKLAEWWQPEFCGGMLSLLRDHFCRVRYRLGDYHDQEKLCRTSQPNFLDVDF